VLSVLPFLHLSRRVKIGKNVWIGYDAFIEAAHQFSNRIALSDPGHNNMLIIR
jgi:hypothetical protein